MLGLHIEFTLRVALSRLCFETEGRKLQSLLAIPGILENVGKVDGSRRVRRQSVSVPRFMGSDQFVG